MKKIKTEYKSVDEYINYFPKDVKIKLEKLRNVIKKTAPKAEEKISYQMPAYSLNGILVYFAGYSKHIGFYPGASGINEFKNEISKYKYAKGSVQFPLTESLPIDLIKRIVKFRLIENMNKKKK
jgi:uncharacterized protein YdhG (YjbR/CyaY superfamily)